MYDNINLWNIQSLSPGPGKYELNFNNKYKAPIFSIYDTHKLTTDTIANNPGP